MAFPYLHHSNWSAGSSAEWDSETDTDSKLSFPSFVDLGIKHKLAPFSGRCGMLIDQSIGTSTTDAVVTETGNFDTSAAGTIYIGVWFYLTGISMAESDVATLFSLDSAGPVVEVGLQIYSSAGTYQVRCGDGSTFRAATMEQDKWHYAEIKAYIENSGNDGTIDFYLDGAQIGAQVTGCNQEAITQARLGLHTITGVAAGKVLYGPVVADDGRVYKWDRFSQNFQVLKTDQLFVGPGAIDLAACLTTSDCSLKLYDTDTANATDIQTQKVELSSTVQSAVSGPVMFDRGCYAVLAGTNPRAQVMLWQGESADRAGFHGPLYYSEWGYKKWAHIRPTLS